MSAGPSPRGFTLLEVVIALAVAAVLGALAVPSFGALVARQRLQATLENLRADVSLARQEASRRGQPVHLHFQGGRQWCYALSTVPVPDCRATAGKPPPPGLIKQVQAASQPGVVLLHADAMTLDPATGGALQLERAARFESAEGQQLQLRLSPMGHTSLCAPAGPVGRVPACPVPQRPG